MEGKGEGDSCEAVGRTAVSEVFCHSAAGTAATSLPFLRPEDVMLLLYTVLAAVHSCTHQEIKHTSRSIHFPIMLLIIFPPLEDLLFEKQNWTQTPTVNCKSNQLLFYKRWSNGSDTHGAFTFKCLLLIFRDLCNTGCSLWPNMYIKVKRNFKSITNTVWCKAWRLHLTHTHPPRSSYNPTALTPLTVPILRL